MSQNPIDAFSKEFLSELLSPFGKVERSFEVPGESKYIDLLFLPIDDIKLKTIGRPSTTLNSDLSRDR